MNSPAVLESSQLLIIYIRKKIIMSLNILNPKYKISIQGRIIFSYQIPCKEDTPLQRGWGEERRKNVVYILRAAHLHANELLSLFFLRLSALQEHSWPWVLDLLLLLLYTRMPPFCFFLKYTNSLISKLHYAMGGETRFCCFIRHWIHFHAFIQKRRRSSRWGAYIFVL